MRQILRFPPLRVTILCVKVSGLDPEFEVKMMEIKGALSRRFSCILTKATQIFNIEPLIFSDIKLFVGHQKEKNKPLFQRRTNYKSIFFKFSKIHRKKLKKLAKFFKL